MTPGIPLELSLRDRGQLAYLHLSARLQGQLASQDLAQQTWQEDCHTHEQVACHSDAEETACLGRDGSLV